MVQPASDVPIIHLDNDRHPSMLEPHVWLDKHSLYLDIPSWSFMLVVSSPMLASFCQSKFWWAKFWIETCSIYFKCWWAKSSPHFKHVLSINVFQSLGAALEMVKVFGRILYLGAMGTTWRWLYLMAGYLPMIMATRIFMGNPQHQATRSFAPHLE